MNVRITGTEDVMRALQALAAKVPSAIERALREESEVVMTEAKQLVPVEVGVLKGTGFVGPVQRRGDVYRADLAFGGPAAGYAEVQHEDETLNHTGTHYSSRLRRRYERTGQAKYLEQPVMEAQPGFAERMRDRIARDLGTDL